MAEDRNRLGLRVLRICSVFEPPDAVLSGRGVRFDAIGGMQNHTAQLRRALDALGLYQQVLTHRPPGSPRTQQIGGCAQVHRFGVAVTWARQLYSAPAAVAAWQRAPAADLVHAHLGEDLAVLPLALAACRHGRIPLIITIHTSLRHTFVPTGPRGWIIKRLGGWIQWHACHRAARIVALTERLAAQIRSDAVNPARICVLPPGVNPSDFSANAPDRFPGIGHPRIVYVGRLADQKGVETLVEAVARMHAREVTVLVVGDGPQRRRIQTLIRRHGLEDRVHITGFRAHHQVAAILQHADVFCLPSRYEELSSALLEAMAAAKPIVATAVGGTPEALGPAGRLVSPDDPDTLARALDDLLAHPNEAERLGHLARQRADSYQWSHIAGQILAMYQDVLKQCPRATPAARP